MYGTAPKKTGTHTANISAMRIHLLSIKVGRNLSKMKGQNFLRISQTTMPEGIKTAKDGAADLNNEELMRTFVGK